MWIGEALPVLVAAVQDVARRDERRPGRADPGVLRVDDAGDPQTRPRTRPEVAVASDGHDAFVIRGRLRPASSLSCCLWVRAMQYVASAMA